MRILLAFLLSGFECFGQTSIQQAWLQAASLGQTVPPPPTYYPTNIPGNLPYAYWTAENVTTNSTIVTLADQMGNGNNLVGTTSASPIGSTNMLNGYPALRFKSSNTPLSSPNYVAPLPHEVMMLCSLSNNANQMAFFSGTNSASGNPGGHMLKAVISIPAYRQLLDTVQLETDMPILTNQYVLIDAFYGTTNTALYTNGVLALSGLNSPSQTNSCHGFMMGNEPYYNYSAEMSFIACVTYTNLLTSAQRTSVWNAIKVKYGL